MGVVEVQDLNVFSDGRWVLEDINLSVNRGEFLSVIGPNGGGKSTLIKAVAGLIKPDRGSVKICGEPPLKIAKAIGYMPQETAVNLSFPIMAIDIVKMGFLAQKTPDEHAAFAALERVKASHLAYKKVGALSGGERQRVFIARSLVGGIAVLLLDEPTSGIDLDGEKTITELFENIKKDLAIICVSHDRARLINISDRIITINHKIVSNEPRNAGSPVI